MPLLAIERLRVEYQTRAGVARALDDVSLTLGDNECLGLVGESGCGKSTLALAVLRVLPPNGRIASGRIVLDGTDVTVLSPRELRRLRWERMALVPQSSMNALDPVYRIGGQIAEAIRAHRSTPAVEARRAAGDLLALTEVHRERIDHYPHELSGGTRQRVAIAMALALGPALLVADEPTTGLDVIVQDQILRRLRELRRDRGMAVLLITHDMGVVAENCDRVAVMYSGRVVEQGAVGPVFAEPLHPYTMGLRNAFPNLLADAAELISIPGSPPNLVEPPAGCRFADRCPFVLERCRTTDPPLVEGAPGHWTACLRWREADELRGRARSGATWQTA
ncbi:MAG: ABC transporter ATP-binding protein [Candidatus Rokubacteria bacterium]|nr:ABC transporter ATP-binding protein [Candidatus Rokubacteria bacterium]